MPRSRAGLVIRWRHEMKRAGPLRADRLALLKKWAEIRTKDRVRTAVDRRQAYNRLRRGTRAVAGRCWACAESALLVNHHVIQIQNGGHSWHLNLVKICGSCHAAIHPWLKART